MILQEKMEKIKSILKKEPKGLTISELSHRIKLNRNSLAKYLEILLVTGQVEMESFGTAKVYCLSQRVPLTGLLQFASDLIALVDEEYIFIQANNNFLSFFGMKREDLLGRHANECTLSPITDEPLVPLIRRAQEQGELTRDIQCTRDGEEVYLRQKIIPTVFDNGSRGATLIIENTTKQRLYEMRLAESEEKYRALAENTLDGILIMRFDGTVLYANPSIVKMAGLDDATEAANRNIFDFILPASQKRAREDLKHMEEGARGYLATYPVTTAIGRERWLECLSTRINYQGEPVNICSIRDITDQLRKDRELIIRESAMATSIGGTAVFDQDLVLVYVNPSFLALFGIEDESEVLGKSVDDLVRGWDSIVGVLDAIKTAISERLEWSGEVSYTEKDSGMDRHLRICAKNVADASGATICTVASFADVTEQRAMESAFRRTYGKLQETIEFMPDPTFIVDQKKEVVAWNQAMEALTGVPKRDILRSRDYHSAFSFYRGHRPVLIDLIDLPAEDLARTYPTVYKVGDSIYIQTYLPHLDQGKGAYLWGKASRLIDEKGKAIGAIESVRDITEWKRAEEALRHVYRLTQNAARDE